ncbi:hypothetical protein ACF0H5_021858 [Mactra antiquata]
MDSIDQGEGDYLLSDLTCFTVNSSGAVELINKPRNGSTFRFRPSSDSYKIKFAYWSFGITLWELMTRGVRPYAAVDNWDMERYLKSGRRLPQPMFCPTPLYKIMRKCWAIEPSDRPAFNSIRQCISDMLEKVHLQLGDAQKNSNIGSVYVNLTNSSKCTYENLDDFEDLPV